MNYNKDSCFHEAIVKLKDYVEKYVNTIENLEIEIRIGYIEDDEFKTDIGKEFFDKIMNRLYETNENTWSSINNECCEDYFYNGRRMSVYDKKSMCIKKVKLAVFDFTFEGSGFDVRVSFSKELPSNKFSKNLATYKRTKNRTSFNHKHLCFDLTKVTMEDNTIENHLFEIEIECKNTNDIFKNMTSHYFIHDMLLKAKDLVEMCEPLETDEPKLLFVKQKIY